MSAAIEPARRWAPRTKRVLAWLDRRFAFHSRGNAARAVVTVCLLGGAVALLLGQDANWDLRNYHLYNGYAWLHDRLARDLAAAQMQSYFSPMLDVLQYALMVHWPAPLAGFVLGVAHALVFAPVAAIAWMALAGHPQRARLAPVLALAGMCSAAFLSEFAGSMADNTTALPVLGALALVLAPARHAEGARPAAARWLLAGALLGAAVAFKLTNAVYALAIAAAVLSCGGPVRARVGRLALLAAVSLLVFALLAGPWYRAVWQAFGNPLLPQFNGWFQSALAQPVSVADTRWLPKAWWEWLTWPLVFTFNPRRASEIALFQCVWASLYLVALLAGLRWLLGRRDRALAPAPAMRAVLVFFLVAYLLWQALFGIHRYLVVLELLAPLVLWQLCRHAFARRHAARAAGALIGLCALVALGGWNDWGHEPWARQGFAVAAPAMVDPGRSLVLMVGDEPQSWRIAFLPGQARYASVASNFPESGAYRERIAALVQASPHRYAMLPASVDRKAGRVVAMNAWAARLGLADQRDCSGLRWLVRR
ncbi:MAG TPA: hypothetical protein DDZ67_00675, partial [Xanthomonadaceae bacterium]|nr:hypothetical protein [Xanthomonadaceae bacterium]